MPPDHNIPGVYAEGDRAAPGPIAPVATSVALFVGWWPQGPLDQAVCLTDVAEFQRAYGGGESSERLGPCVRHFFENGGAEAYVIRLAGADGARIEPGEPAFRDALRDCFAPDGVAESVDLFNLLCVPGLDHPEAIAMSQAFCRRRRAFMIVDSPQGAGVAEMLRSKTLIAGPNADHSALYFPWVQAPDPDRGGALRLEPPCGFVAGVMARTDRARGVWKAPAGVEATLEGAVGLALPITDADAARLNPEGVNCLRSVAAQGVAVWGARTLHGDDVRPSEWKYVPVRRLALFLEESVARGLKWASFEPNDERLWAAIRLHVGDFLLGVSRQGAFVGRTPNEAFFVKCDRGTITQRDLDIGVANVEIGFAPLRPAEFVILSIRLMTADARS